MAPTAQTAEHEVPVIEHRVSELERRVEKLENDTWKAELWKAITQIQKDVANLNGRLAGYLVAGGVLGSALSLLAQRMLK